MRCIPHCGSCNHICINSPMFKKISIEERLNVILNDENIIEENNNSGVYIVTPEEKISFVRDCEGFNPL